MPIFALFYTLFIYTCVRARARRERIESAANVATLSFFTVFYPFIIVFSLSLSLLREARYPKCAF